MLIGITGLAGSGKSEVARVLIEEFGFTRVKFADPLKNMLRTMLRDVGHTAKDVERFLEGDLKESVVDGIGVTARRLMITLGTEWGRQQIADDLWIRLWAVRAEQYPRILADDVRFPNEVAAIRAGNGKIWQVQRPGLAAGEHVSEHLDVEPDNVIVNHGTIEDLRAMVRSLRACA